MSKLTKFLLVTCLLLLVGKRLEKNQGALLTERAVYNDPEGSNIVSVQTLELSRQELKEACERMQEKIDELNIKLKRAESVSQTNTNTTINIMAELRDSLIVRGDTVDKVQVLDWNDPWVSVNGLLDNDSIQLDVQSVDTIIQVVHKVPKRFLWFKYGCKQINQDLMSTNPHTKIVYSKYINVK